MRSLKSVLILSLLLYSFVGFSQTEEETATPTTKGNFVIGGSSNLNFSSTTPKVRRLGGTQDEGKTNTRFSFMPNAGYFVIDNLAVGVGVSLTSSKITSDDLDSESTNTSFVFSVFSRYYFTKGDIKPFLQGTVGLGLSDSKGKINDIDNKVKSSVFNYGLNGGVAFFIGKRVSIDLGAGYISSSRKPRDGNDSNFRFIDKGIGFDVGFNIFF